MLSRFLVVKDETANPIPVCPSLPERNSVVKELSVNLSLRQQQCDMKIFIIFIGDKVTGPANCTAVYSHRRCYVPIRD